MQEYISINAAILNAEIESMDELYEDDVTVVVTNDVDTFYVQTIDGVNYVGDSQVVIVQETPEYVVVDTSDVNLIYATEV